MHYKYKLAALIAMVIATGTLRAQDLKSEIKSDSVRTYLNIGTKYFITPPASNQVRPDSDYVVRIATLNTIKRLLDTIRSIAGGTQMLNDILIRGNTSTQSINLGKATGLHPYSSLTAVIGVDSSYTLQIRDTTLGTFAQMSTGSSLNPSMSVGQGSDRVSMSLNGSTPGVATFHIIGIGGLPAITAKGGAGISSGGTAILLGGTDLCGVIRVITGSSIAATGDTVCKITFAKAYIVKPTFGFVYPANDNAAEVFATGKEPFTPYDGITTAFAYIVMRQELAANTTYYLGYSFMR